MEIDPDIQAVAEFMQAHIPAEKLVGIARDLAVLAPLVWRQHGLSDIQPIRWADRSGSQPKAAKR